MNCNKNAIICLCLVDNYNIFIKKSCCLTAELVEDDLEDVALQPLQGLTVSETKFRQKMSFSTKRPFFWPPTHALFILNGDF